MRRPPTPCALTPRSATRIGSVWTCHPAPTAWFTQWWWMLPATSISGAHFTTAGGTSANHVAKWNGSAWSALGSGVEHHRLCAGGVGQRPVCGRLFHHGGRHQHGECGEMERQRVVGPGVGGERRGHMRWRCRAATCMWEAISPRRAASARQVWRNGTAARGRPWGRGWAELSSCLCAGGIGQRPVCGRRFHHGGRQQRDECGEMERQRVVGIGVGGRKERSSCHALAVSGSEPVCGRLLHHGGRQQRDERGEMERQRVVGLGVGGEPRLSMRWRCRAATCMWGAVSPRRAATARVTWRNGTAARGRPWGLG